MNSFCHSIKIVVMCMMVLFIMRISQRVNASENVEGQTTLVVKTVPIEDIYEAMGTIRPLAESNIHSQISAKVIDVLVSAGDKVKEGELLIRLDSREVTSRLEQAKEGLSIAERGVEQALKMDEELAAEFTQAESDYNRAEKLYNEGVQSKKDYDQAKTRFLKTKAQAGLLKERVSSAKASLRQAKEVVKEAALFVEYADIRALNSGVITNRDIDPGDLATPLQPLLTIQTGSSLRLEVGVRESLIDRISVGMSLDVSIGSQKVILKGTVEEIEPYADAKTRSFMVKVGIPNTAGIYPGMFGRLLIPLDTVGIILIPIEAIRTIGQLKYVDLAGKNGKARRIYVKTGHRRDDMIEVVSGLEEGDALLY